MEKFGGGQPFTQSEKDKLNGLLASVSNTGTYSETTTGITEIASVDVDPNHWYLVWSYVWLTASGLKLVGYRANHSTDKTYNSYQFDGNQGYCSPVGLIGGVSSIQCIVNSGCRNIRANMIALRID